MQGRASGGEILQAKRPADVLGGIEPLFSSANSKWDGLIIERYRVEKFGPTPRFCFSEHHDISVYRDGIVEVHDKRSTILYSDSLAIFPAGAPQSSYTLLKTRVTLALLDPAFVRRALGNVINSDALEIIPTMPTLDEQLDHFLRAAEIEIESGLPGGRLFLESLGTALAAHLLTHYAAKRVTPRHYGNMMPQHLLRRTIDFIQENLGKDLSLADLSAGVQMSKYHFCHLFKRSTGLSPHQYVKRARVQRARQLLAEHRFSLV